MITLEEFTLFDVLLAPTNLSLSNFKENSSIITIDSNKIKFVSVSDSISNKSRITYPTNIDSLIGFIKNFCFATSFFVKESSFSYSQWKQGTKIVKKNSVALKALEIVVQHLLAKILYYMNSKMQAFLHLYTKATTFEDIKNHLLA